MSFRMVISGIGAVTPIGASTATYWDAVRKGVSGLGWISRFDLTDYPCRVGGEVHDIDLAEYVLPRIAAQTDRWTQLGLVAAGQALEDSGHESPGESAYDTAVITASSSGGNEFGQREIHKLWSDGPHAVGAYQSIAWFYAATTGQVAIKHGAKGPCGVLATESAGGLDAIGQSRRVLRRGEAKAVITGATEAPISPYALACQLRGGRLSLSDDPMTAYQPFSTAAAGHVVGEGGAMLLVEQLSRALDRGAERVYAEIVGYAATHDGRHTTATPTGDGLARAARLAIADAGIDPAEVDAVFADGAATPELDQAEVATLRMVFGARQLPICLPKTLVGRMYAGSPALDVATAALALYHGELPPSPVVEKAPWAADLDLVHELRTADLRHVVVLARGYGGFNAAVVLRKIEINGN
ncbi:beta-ketoacyl synthase N-terminal-like domain-containing protein [Amycolatopsis sp. H20-H5]|uniref:beta-ketoacyl synthase N-terminal-like domain-containing protein n=1 Tax=Amycolatopsis sp. H20-H5 TaxID=3046309 RepID=UPI002DBA4581|nr:beta-ketoacyl synthase N-terminal-like domain-containing protein [Amycolatopsis sp. H20-H5]MEC3974252.1 beta-ketoacyl synthase N-terminal-like domain-containing protein [Amycolatopsis sp. H20-H5]